MISTKGRYALRVLIDLAEQDTTTHVPLKEIAKRQGISEKYLQQIVKILVGKGLLTGISGKGGGHRLTASPEEYNVGEILELMEGSLTPVACLASDTKTCSRSPYCKTLPMWKKFDNLVHDYFFHITIADLVNGTVQNIATEKGTIAKHNCSFF